VRSKIGMDMACLFFCCPPSIHPRPSTECTKHFTHLVHLAHPRPKYEYGRAMRTSVRSRQLPWPITADHGSSLFLMPVPGLSDPPRIRPCVRFTLPRVGVHAKHRQTGHPTRSRVLLLSTAEWESRDMGGRAARVLEGPFQKQARRDDGCLVRELTAHPGPRASNVTAIGVKFREAKASGKLATLGPAGSLCIFLCIPLAFHSSPISYPGLLRFK